MGEARWMVVFSHVPGVEGQTGCAQADSLPGRAAAACSSLVSFSCAALTYQC